MTAQTGDAFRDKLLANQGDFGVKIDDRFLVYGGSSAGEAAFAPSAELPGATAEMLASGVVLGLVAVERGAYASESRDGLAPGLYAVRHTVSASTARSELLDATNDVVSSAAIELRGNREQLAKLEAESDVVLGEVGGVTVSVGWLHVCFEWDDPPGTPGGICHRSCYGW